MRPFSGSDSALEELMTSPVWVVSVWIMGATSLISTVCAMSPTSSVTSTRAVWSTSSRNGGITAFLNPVTSAVSP